MTTEPATTPFATIVLAAGHGTRMKSKIPKVLHPLAGRPMLSQLLATLETLGSTKQIIVVSPENQDAINTEIPGLELAVQHSPLGTGHAVIAAQDKLTEFEGDILVLFGDSPLVSIETLRKMLNVRRSVKNPAVVVMGFKPQHSKQYARLKLDEKGNLLQVIEYLDATDNERQINLCNSGFMAIDGTILNTLLAGIETNNAKAEYYLTEIVEIANREGRTCSVVEASEIEAYGINNRVQLAHAESLIQNRLRHTAMDVGVTLLDPESVFFSHDTVLGQDVTIQPNVYIGPGVTIGDNVTINAFCHLEGCQISSNSSVGPFARLRQKTKIGNGARIGNFVEVKNATIEDSAKVNHLSYIGDARVGEGANIGAGTITCNYDGFLKSFTDIGKGAFIGSNSALVAPIKVGDGAIVGAGSTITKEVSAEALVIERSTQSERQGGARKFRKRKIAEQAARNKN